MVASFEGLIEQVPPATSALKVRGVPAYRRAARGQIVTLPARSVRVYWTRVHDYAWPALDFEVCCGRGTYVRSLIRDVGAGLGVGGCLTGLTRTAVGPFRIENAWTIDRLRDAASADEFLIPIERGRDML